LNASGLQVLWNAFRKRLFIESNLQTLCMHWQGAIPVAELETQRYHVEPQRSFFRHSAITLWTIGNLRV
jgi:hypothetical protein